ncbi:hypothetical protein [Jeotgalibaca sp. A127]|uniref:hypothetical protein n=1 Tax=Jeotgalibaca sp. A127 TaxID=3457324 RepID=UPI003FD635AA
MIPKNQLFEEAFQMFLTAAPVSLKSVPFFRKLKNERKLKQYATKLQSDLNSTDDREEIKMIVTTFLLKLDEEKLLFERPFLKYFLEKGYLDVAEQFMNQAAEMDGKLKTWEVYQAMRNVWIMNSLQLYWDLPLELTSPVYAYSMLYPYTDNYLDNPDISLEEKKEFNEHISRALRGEPTYPDRLTELFAMIEGHFPREQFPEVFESIAFIHEAQIASLHQHGTLKKEEILRLSFMKGGASVLADAFLVKGTLTKEEMRFAFEYGAFLQLLDDLQDIDEDKKDGHFTLFSAKEGLLDEEVRQLLKFIYATNAPLERNQMKDVIRTCTIMMVMEAVSRSPERISRTLYKKLEAASPVRLSFYKEMMGFFETITTNTDLDAAIETFR